MSVFKQRAAQHLAASSIFAAILIGIMWPVVFQGKVLMPSAMSVYYRHSIDKPFPFAGNLEHPEEFAQSDELEEHLSWKTLVHRRLRRGDVPLWNPFSAAGKPLLANNQSAVFAPTTLFFLWVKSPSRALTLGTMALLFIGALALYGFLRLHRVGFAAACVGGVLSLLILTVGEVLVEHFNVMTRCWSMATLFLLAVALQRSNWNWTILAALSAGMTALSGNLQITYNGLILWGLYLAALAMARSRDLGRRRLLRIIAQGAVVFCLGLLIGTVQILPMYELLTTIDRSFTLPEIVEASALSLPGQAEWIIAGFGIGGVVLALIGGLQRRWLPAFFLALAAAGVCLNTGGKLYALLYHTLPFFHSFNIDTNYLMSPMTIVIPALVGFGVDRLLKSQSKSRKWLALILCAACFCQGPVPGLLTVGSRFYKHVFGAPSELTPALPCVQALQKDRGLHRFARYRTWAFPPNLGIRFGLHDSQDYDSFVMTRYGEFMQALEPGIFINWPLDIRIVAFRRPETLALPALNLLGVKYLLSGERLSVPQWEEVASDPQGFCFAWQRGYWIYRNRKAIPRAFLVPGIRAVEDKEAMLREIVSPDFNPAACALVESPLPEGLPPGSCGEADTGDVEVTRYANDEIELIADLRRSGFLLLADTYLPGWEAWVDGERAELLRADYIFRLVPLDAGAHEIRFIYRPRSYLIGRALSAAGLAICLVFLPAAEILRRRRNRAMDRERGC